MAIFFTVNVAEAGANIRYEATNVRIEPGKCIIYGYFYNSGDVRARVNEMHFIGTVDGIKIDVVSKGDELQVGYIEAYDARTWTFIITKNDFKTYNNNPNRTLKAITSYGN